MSESGYVRWQKEKLEQQLAHASDLACKVLAKELANSDSEDLEVAVDVEATCLTGCKN